MYADDVQAVLVENTFGLVAQVVKVALADALAGERSGQEFLDIVAPDWRERWNPPAPKWTLEAEPVPEVAPVAPPPAPPKLCECGQVLTGHGNRKWCDQCQRLINTRRCAERRQRVNATITPPATIDSVKK